MGLTLDGRGRSRSSVSDEGAGLDPTIVEAREGVQIMSARIAALGVTSAVDSAPGKGTTVPGSIPTPRARR